MSSEHTERLNSRLFLRKRIIRFIKLPLLHHFKNSANGGLKNSRSQAKNCFEGSLKRFGAAEAGTEPYGPGE